MSAKKPLVIGDEGRPQQLQSTDTLDVQDDALPLADRVARLERIIAALAPQLLEIDIDIQSDLEGLVTT
jgi:hypothetical protein